MLRRPTVVEAARGRSRSCPLRFIAALHVQHNMCVARAIASLAHADNTVAKSTADDAAI
jgi:hypothetical protein